MENMKHETLLLSQEQISSLITMKEVVEIVDKTFVGFGEGDLVEFGDQMLRVTGLAENAPKVVFCTMGEESPAVEQAEAGRPEAVAASAAAPTPPGNVSEAPEIRTFLAFSMVAMPLRTSQRSMP